MVTAVDDGPYRVDAIGHRMIDAVGRAAALIARQHGGYPEGGSRCDVSMLQILRGPDSPIVCTSLGARPPTPFGDWDQTLDELFGDDLLHQGTCYPATAPALPFLTRMITSNALPARQRLDLYVWLLVAADRGPTDCSPTRTAPPPKSARPSPKSGRCEARAG
jgi:hypothetical protein